MKWLVIETVKFVGSEQTDKWYDVLMEDDWCPLPAKLIGWKDARTPVMEKSRIHEVFASFTDASDARDRLEEREAEKFRQFNATL